MRTRRQNPCALPYADEALRRDRNFVLAAVAKNSNALQHVDEAFRRDRDVVLAAGGWLVIVTVGSPGKPP